MSNAVKGPRKKIKKTAAMKAELSDMVFLHRNPRDPNFQSGIKFMLKQQVCPSGPFAFPVLPQPPTL